MKEIEALQLVTVCIELLTAFISMKIVISEFQFLKREIARNKCHAGSLLNMKMNSKGEELDEKS